MQPPTKLRALLCQVLFFMVRGVVCMQQFGTFATMLSNLSLCLRDEDFENREPQWRGCDGC